MATVYFESASELATLTNTFTVGSTPTDPTTVSLTVTSPSGTATTYTYAAAQITRTSAGVYTKSIACSEDGDWQYVWTGTGTVEDVVAGTWTVFPTDVGHLYATVEALKSRIKIEDSEDDFEIHQACFTASREIEQVCERVFYRSPADTARTFVPTDRFQLRLPEFSDLVSLAALKTDTSGDGVFDTTWTSSDYQLLPVNPAAAPEQRPYTKIKAVGSRTFPIPYTRLARDDRIEVTGVFGWPAVPMAVKTAALVLAEDLFKLRETPFGSGGYAEFGRIRARENPNVMLLIGRYQRNAVLAA